MDPVSALGVAASIVTFVQFTQSLFSGSSEIYTSFSGLSERNGDIKEITASLNGLNAGIQRSLGQAGVFSPRDKELHALSTRCGELAQELIAALDKLSVREGRDKWDSFKAALETAWGAGKIKSLQERLEGFWEQIEAHINVSTSEQLTLMRKDHTLANSRLLDSFEATRKLNQKLLDHMHQNTHQNTQWQTEIIAAIDNIQEHRVRLEHGAASTQEHFYQERAERFQAILFQLLKYIEMESREEGIAQAYEKTFEWIFNPPKNQVWSDFKHWLQSDDSLYWITGKPGAGKSTLMKFICNDSRTKKYLSTFASGRDVFVSSFYFWNSGVRMQMTQEGLLRTLLYDALQRLPHLISKVFPTRLQTFLLFGISYTMKEPLSWTELLRAFKLFIREATKSLKLVLFIDGLDEFEGAHKQLIDFVHSLLAPNVKICVSSRPWNVFEDEFASRPSLRLEDLTSSDIKLYVSSKLSANLGFQAQQAVDIKSTEQLVINVTIKATGVFLWVMLVTQSLLEGLTDGEHLSRLQQRLDSLPVELESLFWKILGSVGSQNLEKASRLFQIHRAAKSPLTLIELSCADEENLDYVLEMPLTIDFQTERNLDNRAELMRRRLNACCKGLLEIQRGRTTPLARAVVGYLHRTVKDWFAEEDTWKRLLDATSKSGFDLNLRLCANHIGHLKTLLNLQWSKMDYIWEWVRYCINSIIISDLRPGSGQQVRWLNGIDRTVKEVRAIMPQYSGASWTTELPGSSSCASFLHLTVKFQLVPYVESSVVKLQKLNTMELFQDALFSLLETATLGYSIQGTLYPSLDHTSPNPQLINTLLAYGADPNRHNGKKVTLWDLALQEHKHSPEVLKPFIVHGANLRKSDIQILRNLDFDAETSQVLHAKEREIKARKGRKSWISSRLSPSVWFSHRKKASQT